jgi:acylphosphatase
MSECLHIIVRGRVQGVYFRVYTHKQALKMGVRGYVRNLANGDVEIVAGAAPEVMQQFLTWCRRGPLLARVDELVVNPHLPDQGLVGFEIL